MTNRKVDYGWEYITRYKMKRAIEKVVESQPLDESACPTITVEGLMVESSTPDDETHGWKPIATAPKDGTTILGLCACMGGFVINAMFWSDLCHKWMFYRIQPSGATLMYWHPLPEVPPTLVLEVMAAQEEDRV